MVRTREHADAQLRMATTFAEKLDSLKRTGCNLLVVGADHQPTHSDACRRLLASGGNEPRRRVLIATDTSVESVQERIPHHETTPEDSPPTVIDVQTPTRSTVAHAPSPPSGVDISTVSAGDLSRLGIEIHEAISELDATYQLGPSEFRLCFDSLSPLVEREDAQTVFRFMHLVTGSVTRVSGMGHYHLPIGRDAESIRILEPLFDAIIELRTQAGTPEQRWHLVREDVVTDWIPQ